MAGIIEECNSLVDELNRFSDDFIELKNSIDDNRVEELESKLKIKLPFDFKFIIKKFNGFSLNGVEVYGIGKEFKDSSLDKVFKFEHQVQSSFKMPTEFIPFSPDGQGNHYCLDVSLGDGDTCPIAFWQPGVDYESKEQIEVCNDSFVSWVNEVMIGWTLEDYNYDGTERR